MMADEPFSFEDAVSTPAPKAAPAPFSFEDATKPPVQQERAPYNGGDMFLHGATLGLSDQLYGVGRAAQKYVGDKIDDLQGVSHRTLSDLVTGNAAETPSFGERYTESMRRLRAGREAFEREHPWQSAAENVGGGFATAGAGALKAVAGKVAEPVIDAVAPAAETVLSRIATGGKNLLKGSAIGAGVGGAQTAADVIGTEDAATANRDIQRGMLMGGLFGAAPPAVGETVGAVRRGVRAFSPSTIAAETVQRNTSDPSALREAVAQPAEAIEIVPGSRPTVGQLTQDPKLQVLERGIQARRPDLFNQLRAAQEEARVGSIGEITPQGSPQSVGDLVRAELDRIDKVNDTTVSRARRQAQDAQEGVGGEMYDSPAAYGQALRDEALSPAKAASKAHERKLWQAIDPDNTLSLDISPAQDVAKRVAADTPQSALVAPIEQHFLETIQNWNRVQPLSEFQALRSDLGNAISQERMNAGETPVWRRLVLLREGLNDTLAGAAERHADDLGVQQGGLSDWERSIRESVRSWEQQRRDVATGQDAGESVSRLPNDSGQPSGVPATQGTRSEGAGGSPNAPRDQSVSVPERPVGPTWDEEATARYKAARDATAEAKATFGTPSVKSALQYDRNTGFRMPNERVAARFLQSPTDTEAFVKAVGGREEAVQTLNDYLAFRFRNDVVKNGEVAPAAYRSFMKKYGDVIDQQFPELRGKFDTAAKAQETLEQTMANAIERKRDFERSALAPFLNTQEPSVAVKSILSGNDSAQKMRAAMGQIGRNQDAINGMRRAVADYIVENFTKEVGTEGQKVLKSDAFQKFVNSKRGALEQALGRDRPEDVSGMQVLDRIAADLRRTNPQAAKIPGQSNTPQDLAAMKKQHEPQTILGMAMDEASHGIPGLLVLTHNAPAAAGTFITRILRRHALNGADDMLAEAMTDPKVMEALLKKTPQTGNPAAWNAFSRGLSVALGERAAK